MFSVIFEVHPKTEQWDVYLDNAKMLRPELEQVDGFVDNIRYRSLTRQDGFCRFRIGAMRSPWSAGVRECGTTKSKQKAARKSCWTIT